MFELFHLGSIGSALTLAGVGWLIYLVALGIWRLYFSPIAKFPGPKIAALTYWYEGYYDIYHSGQYVWKIREFHEKYGPIIRINPHELHFSDPEFYHTIYAGGANKRNRDKWHVDILSLPGSHLQTVEHDLHRNRRAALNPFFSMQSTRKLLPRVQERIDSFVSRIQEEKDSGKAINLMHALAALSNDVIEEYVFGICQNRLQEKNFDPSYHRKITNAGVNVVLFRYFPMIPAIMLSLPPFIANHIGELADQFRAMKIIGQKIEEVRGDSTKVDQRTIFHTLLESDLPESEKSTARLTYEAYVVVGGGSHTVAWTLSIASYYLLSSPTLLQKLKAELATVKLEDEKYEDYLQRLEKLPYLTAVIKESLRLSYGTGIRLPRSSPVDAVTYHDPISKRTWVIPPGTSMSMTSILMHQDERIFKDALEFKPERWLEDKDGKLDRYMVVFSAGSRICLGINLAWAELYVMLAGLMGIFGGKGVEGGDVGNGKEWEVRSKGDIGTLELYQTDASDVEAVGALFFPVIKAESQGIRVLVKS